MPRGLLVGKQMTTATGELGSLHASSSTKTPGQLPPHQGAVDTRATKAPKAHLKLPTLMGESGQRACMLAQERRLCSKKASSHLKLPTVMGESERRASPLASWYTTSRMPACAGQVVLLSQCYVHSS